MLSCTITYSEGVKKLYSLSKEELFSFKLNICFNPNHFKITGAVEALGSSCVFFPLSYSFPYKNMAEMLLLFRENQNLSGKRPKSGFLIGTQKCSLKSWWVNYQQL